MRAVIDKLILLPSSEVLACNRTLYSNAPPRRAIGVLYLPGGSVAGRAMAQPEGSKLDPSRALT